jgi:uncharacterized protein (TIGR00251 family)
MAARDADDTASQVSGRTGERPTLREAHGALLVPVRVVPRASREDLSLDGGVLRARVTAPPVDGAANEALVALIAGRLGLPRRAVALASGAASRQKVVAVAGLDAETFWRRLGL